MGGVNEKMEAEMLAEGYLALAQENQEYAILSAEIAHEVIPEWE